MSFTKFSMYQISPNNCYLSSSDFYLGRKPKSRGGGTLNAEVIGMLVRNVLENPKKYPNCWRNALKNTNFTENFLETSHFYSIWKMSKPKNTRISILHKTFQKTLKNTRIRILCPKNTTSISITLPWKYNPPPAGGNINYSIHMQKLWFLYDEKAVPASRSKVQEDKRKWNLPHSGKRLSFIIRRKSLTLKPILTQGISEKLLKNGQHISPPRHTFMWRLE